MKSLPLFHTIHGQRVVLVAEGAMGDAKRRLIERAGGVPVSETMAHGARLAFVAVDHEGEARKVALRLKRLGLLVNVADRPELCDFTTPSLLDRDPVLIAVGTAGASAGLAKHIRLRLERLLPETLGLLASGLADARDAMRSRWPDGDTRRRAVDDAMREGGLLDPFDDASHTRIEHWLAQDTDNAPREETVQLRSLDPDDLTLREARWLGLADSVLHDGVPADILARARADAERGSLGDPSPAEGFTVRLLLPDQPSSASDRTASK